VHQRKRCQVRV